MERADVLFEYVRRRREESTIDRACIAAAMHEASRLPAIVPIAVNVHASTLGRDHEFVSFISRAAAEARIELSNLTVEIVEHTPFWDGASFRRALAELRERGVRIALDDIGLGQSNYRMMLECRPDFFKIDRYFIAGSADDPFRQAVVDSIATLARRFGSRVIAEGVEREEDLQTVLEAGIDLVQGHIFAPALTSGAFTRDDLTALWPVACEPLARTCSGA